MMISTPWQWQFPPIAKPEYLRQQIISVAGEVKEALDAYDDGESNERIAEELMDVCHRAETALRELEETGVDLDAVKRGVIEKNDARGYYGVWE